MSAVTLTFSAERRAEIVALFTVSDDTLADRVRTIGTIAADNGNLSGAKIYAALLGDADIAPVGLSSASVDNAKSAYTMAHDLLGADASAAYAEVLTAIHAVRVKPLREAWEAAIKSAKLPKSKSAERAALIPAAVQTVRDARAAEVKRKADERAASKAPAPTDGDADGDADGSEAPTDESAAPVSLALSTLARVAGMLASMTDADEATALAEAAAMLASAAADRAAELTATAAPVAA